MMPPTFAQAFVAEANRQEREYTNGQLPDEVNPPIGELLRVTDECIWLTNDCPGFSPLLRIAGDGGVAEVGYFEESGFVVQASARIDLTDPPAAAKAALTAWYSTL